MYCDGVYNSSARIGKCGVCIGGSTNRTEKYGEDKCGICNGTNLCVDCDGTPNGIKKRDSCNQCLDPSSASFGTGCVAFSENDCSVLIKNDAKRKCTITGSKISDINTISVGCYTSQSAAVSSVKYSLYQVQ